MLTALVMFSLLIQNGQSSHTASARLLCVLTNLFVTNSGFKNTNLKIVGLLVCNTVYDCFEGLLYHFTLIIIILFVCGAITIRSYLGFCLTHWNCCVTFALNSYANSSRGIFFLLCNNLWIQTTSIIFLHFTFYCKVLVKSVFL